MKILRVVLLVGSMLPLTLIAVQVSGSYQDNAPTGVNISGWDTGWGAVNVSGWDYVGTVGGASAVYLGNGWVITANHVGTGGSFSLGGQDYRILTDSVQENVGGSGVDLKMFQLDTTLALPDLTIPALALNLTGRQVVLIGYGGGVKAWAAQNAAGSAMIGDSGSFMQTYFVEDLNSSSLDNARGIGGDSGGALFYLSGGTWQLAGVMVGVNDFTVSAPAGWELGYYTFSVKLGEYSEDINAILSTSYQQVPEPAAWALWLGGAGALWLAARRRK